MAKDRRNPYVILGVPFGANAAEARTGFANASRVLRIKADAPYSIEDLTWALHQIEQIIEEPSKAFEVYRIPANRQATMIRRPGVFNPEPERLKRNTEPTTGEQWKMVRILAAKTVLLDAIASVPLTLKIARPYDAKELTDGEKQ